MRAFPILMVGLIVFGVIALLIWYFSEGARLKRAMKSVPLRRIRDVMEGEKARVVGRARPVDSPLFAPLSGRACTCWRVIVQEMRGSGKRRRWVTIIDESDGRDFYIEDDDDKAVVRMSVAQPLLVEDGVFDSGFLNDASPALEAFLRKHGHQSVGYVFNKSMRYREGAVEPGERVSVVGKGRWEPDPDPAAQARVGYRGRAKRLMLEAPAQSPLLVTDHVDVVESG